MRCFHRPGWVFKANRYYTRVLTKNRSRSMLLALILIVHLPCVKNSRAQGNVIFLRARDLYLRARGHVNKGKYFGQNSLFLPSPSPYFFPVF